jgi:hypothetical protein
MSIILKPQALPVVLSCTAQFVDHVRSDSEPVVVQVESGASRFALYIVKDLHTPKGLLKALKRIPRSGILQVAFYKFEEDELKPYLAILSSSQSEVRNMFLEHCRLNLTVVGQVGVSVLQFRNCTLELGSALKCVKTIMEGSHTKYMNGFHNFITHFPNLKNYVDGHIANSYINSIHYQIDNYTSLTM